MNKGIQPTHTGRLDSRIRRIWEDLGRIGPQYTLVGGTAIALYCNHRESVDVDLSCRGAAEHPRTIRRNIRAELGKHKVLQRRTGVVLRHGDDSEDRGPRNRSLEDDGATLAR